MPLVVVSPQMKYSLVFAIFGWVLIATSVVLLFVPGNFTAVSPTGR